MRLSARGSLSSLLGICLLSLCLFAVGCATGVQSTGSSSMPQLRGMVHGGSQPITGASIQLYAAGTTGYGTGATALLNTPVTTDATGSFSITGDYTCPSSTSQVYLVATGGNPGLAPGTNNAAIVLMTALGPCTLYGSQYTLNPNSFVFINEATTVASVYALAPFMNPVTTQVGATSTNATGLANAFLSVQNLVNTATGIPLATTPAGNGTVPQAELDTLADILASCVNSNGVNTICLSLQTATTPSGGPAPTTILQAIYNIATNPASQVAALYALAAADAPFQPTLTTAPNDWTVALNFTGGGLDRPVALAIDGAGDVWAVSLLNSTINKFNGATGAAISPSTGFTGGGITEPFAIAIDSSGNAWTSTGYDPSSVIKLNSDGVPLSPSGGYAVQAVISGIAINGANDVWIAGGIPDGGGGLIELNGSTGDLISPPQGYNPGAGNGPEIAIDNSGNVWTGGDVTELNGSTGAPISPSTGYTSGATFIAVDSSNNIWLTTGVTYSQPYGNITSFGSVIKLNGTTGAPLSPSTGYTAGGSLNPSGLAIDGAGNVWLANHTQAECTCENLIELNGSTGAVISGSTGYVGGGIINPAALAIDGSGNVWVANGLNADLDGYATSITEFVGPAAPVVTPQAVAVANHSIATRP